MGAWGHLAFDNDTANDWAYDLDDVTDLSLVESALGELAEVGDDYLHQRVSCNALAACEVLARCQGRPGYKNAYTEKVDDWVTKHQPKPSPALLKSAAAAIDRILGNDSELRGLWDDSSKGDAWRQSVEELRQRVAASPE
jgi:hypothetical protein